MLLVSLVGLYSPTRPIGLTHLREPIDLLHTGTRRFSFIAKRSEPCVLEIETRSTFDHDTQNALLGIGSKSDSIPSEIHLRWDVSSNGSRLVSGTTEEHGGGSWSSGSYGKTIVNFEVKEGLKYDVASEVIQPSPRLAEASPHLIVTTDPLSVLNALGTRALLRVGSLVVGLGAMVMLLGSLVKHIRRRQRD